MLKRLGAVLAVVVAAHLALLTPPAFADGCPDGTTPAPAPGGGVICIVVTDPGTPDDPGDGGTAPTGSGGGCHRDDGSPVTCVSEWGTWDDAHQCWAHSVDVPANDPVWGGHDNGSIWMCALIDDTAPMVTWWVPPGAAPAPVDPGELAQQAVGLLPLETAEVQTAPQSPDRSYVGVENWLWVPSSQWTTLTKTVSAGGTSVTVTARPDRVVWDMGPATTTCFSAGLAWASGMTDAAETTCGFTYSVTSRSQPDLSARIQYQVDWTCAGCAPVTPGVSGWSRHPLGAGRCRFCNARRWWSNDGAPHEAVGTDHGSLGIFQQQWPSWGSMRDLMDPAASAGTFYDALTKVPGWQALPVTVAAQSVQSSAYPAAYADDEPLARRLLVDVGGDIVAATDCATLAEAGEVVFPLPPGSAYVDQHNFGDSGSYWASTHTGTDLSVACGTPVLAATSGTVHIDQTEPWAGTWLVQISTGLGRLTTWYAHTCSASPSATATA